MTVYCNKRSQADSPANPKVQSGLQLFENPFQTLVRGNRPLGIKPRYEVHTAKVKCGCEEQTKQRKVIASRKLGNGATRQRPIDFQYLHLP